MKRRTKRQRAAAQGTAFGAAFSPVEQLLPSPGFGGSLAVSELADGQDTWRVVATIDEVIDGAFYLYAEVGTDDASPTILAFGQAVAVAGVVNIPVALPITGETVARKVRLAWITAEGRQGAATPWTDALQVPILNPPPEVEDPEWTVVPTLIPDPLVGYQEGGVLDVTDGAFVNDADDTATYTLWRSDTIPETLPTNEATPAGFTQVTYTFGSTALDAALVGKYLWPRGAIDGPTYAWGPPSSVVTAIPAPPRVDLEEADVEVLGPFEVSSGLWQPVFRIIHDDIDPADFDGLGVATGLKIRVAFTSATVDQQTALEFALMELIPGDATGNSPLLTAIDASYTAANNYWRLSETDAQQTANAGGNWQDSDLLKESRAHDTVAPRRILRFWHVSLDGGATHGDLSDWSVQVDIPADPPVEAEEYWKSTEVYPAGVTGDPDYYGYGVQFTRCQQFCEDEPNYGIAVGDMNGVRVTETLGATWYVPVSTGMRCFAFNSCYIDPVDRNLLLAEGSMAWDSTRTNPSYVNQIGIWRSTDFGENWTFVYAKSNSNLEGFNQQNFCYDPATRGNPISSRTIYHISRVYLTNQAIQRIELIRSTNGGAAWSVVYSTTTPGTFGKIYQLRHHPSANTLWMATETGLWVSNTAKTAWTRVAGGLPAAKCTSVRINPAGSEVYCTIRTAATAGNQGLWRSADNGASWTRVYSALPVKRVDVDWVSSPEVVFLQLNNENPAMVVSTAGNGSGPWNPCSTTIKVVGNESDAYHNMLSTRVPRDTAQAYQVTDQFEGMIVPKLAGACIVNSVGRMFRTLDKGVNFADVTHGYTGLNLESIGKPLVVEHPTNPLIKALVCQDMNCQLSVDGGKSYSKRQIPHNSSAWGISSGAQSSFVGGITRSGTLLFGQGHITAGQGLARSTTQGATWDVTPLKGGNLFFCAIHPTSSPAAIACGALISKDDGVTWPIGGNGRVEGMSRAGVTYWIAGNGVQRSTNWATSNPPTFTEFYNWAANANPTKFGISACILRASWAEENTIWTTGAGKDLIRVRNSGNTAGTAVITPFPLKGQPGTLADPFFEIADIAPDPRDPNLVYVTLRVHGAPHVWRGTISGSDVSWDDITHNCPRWWDCSIHVSVYTGDVYVGSGVGVWVFPPPDGYQATWGATASVWGDLPDPVKFVEA